MPPKRLRAHRSILRAGSSLRTLLRRVSLHHCLALPRLRSVANNLHRRLSKRPFDAHPRPCLCGRNVREHLHGCTDPDEQLEAVDDAVNVLYLHSPLGPIAMARMLCFKCYMYM